LTALKERLLIDEKRLEEVNAFLLQEDNPLVNGILEIIERHGGVEEINRKARENSQLETRIKRLEKMKSPFLKDIDWLIKQRDREAFISIPEYRRKILGRKADSMQFDESSAVTLEISACNFFPWRVEEAKKAIKQRDLMPARYIRVRSMKEQAEDGATPLAGFNLSNSVDNRTIELAAYTRKAFGFDDAVRIEHHITEAYKSIVRQPYDRLNELLKLADHVKT
jgi:hypothetical protein